MKRLRKRLHRKFARWVVFHGDKEVDAVTSVSLRLFGCGRVRATVWANGAWDVPPVGRYRGLRASDIGMAGDIDSGSLAAIRCLELKGWL